MRDLIEQIRGAPGHTPTDDELLALIKPLIEAIPKPKDGHTPTQKELLSLIRPLIPLVKDGETPSDERLIRLIKPFIPREGKDADPAAVLQLMEQRLPELGEKVRDSLELLQDDERLEGKAVKGWEDILKKIADLEARPRGGIGGMRKITHVDVVRLTGDVDGNRRAFTLPQDVDKVIAVASTQFPITFDETDWTHSGSTLTLSSSIPAIQDGQTLMVIVRRNFYG